MIRCSVVIPVYNRAGLTKQCLETIFSSPPERAELEVIVVDDASSDSTGEILARQAERIQIVRHEQNTGFATACNDGAAAASGEWILFLNNDTVPQPGWLDALIDYASARQRVGLVGAKLLYPDGTIQHAGVVISSDLEPHHLYTLFPADHPAVNKSRKFQIVTAACALLRRETFERIGGFDPAFVNGYEDIDLCLRLRQAGYEIHYCHTSVLHHLEGATRDYDLDSQNHALFLERWSDFVYRDDLMYFSEDGLIDVSYREHFPVLFSVSPELAILKGERAGSVERMLAKRSQQVFEARKEKTRLQAELLDTRAHAEAAGRPAEPVAKSERP